MPRNEKKTIQPDPPAHDAVEDRIRLAMQSAEDGQDRQARQLFEEAIRHDSGSTSRTAYAGYLLMRRELISARAMAGAAVECAVRRGSTEERVRAYTALAHCLRECGETAAARTYQQLALRALTAAGNSCDGPTLSACGADALAAGDLHLAERLFASALVWERAHGSPFGAASDWGNLAIVAFQRRKLLQAAVFLARAARLHRRHGFRQELAQDYANLAEMLISAGRTRRACRWLERSRKLYLCVGDSRSAQRVARRLRQLRCVRGMLQADPSRN